MHRPRRCHSVTHALVHRVLFDGKRAIGTEFSRSAAAERWIGDPRYAGHLCLGQL
jgi:hypothetical protein